MKDACIDSKVLNLKIWESVEDLENMCCYYF